jgi:hypothetical protein
MIELLKSYIVAGKLMDSLLKRPYKNKFVIIAKIFEFLSEYDIATKLLMLLMELRPQEFVILGFDKESGLIEIYHIDTGFKFRISKKDWLKILIDKSNK